MYCTTHEAGACYEGCPDAYENEPALDDRYRLQQKQNGEWVEWGVTTFWGGTYDYSSATKLAKIARNYGRTVRVVDALGQEA